MLEWTRLYSDPQRRGAVAYCHYCDRGLYDGDIFYDINSKAICEDCLALFAQEFYSNHRISGREWRKI